MAVVLPPDTLTLRQQIRQWLTEIDAAIPPLGHKTKHIRDPLHGSIVLSPHEVRLIDTSVFQRLRTVHQLGLAWLTFPSARHTRFEHALGVRHIAERMVDRLEDVLGRRYPEHIRATILTAALLHDVGHGVFSHATESIVSEFPYLREQYEPDDGQLHEQVGAILITEDPLATCLRACGVDPEAVAALMRHDIPRLLELGIPAEVWGIISGPLDADKLDYFARDSYFSGVVSAVDPDRILQTLTIGPQDQLAITLAGASALDQMLYDRVRMYGDLYGHQKILAAESMVRAMVETMLKRGPHGKRSQIFIRGPGGRSLPLRMDRIVDFLRLGDEVLLAAPTDSPVVASIQDRLQRRELLRAAYTLSYESVQGIGESDYLIALQRLRQKSVLGQLRTELHEQHPEVPFSDIWLASVRSPKMAGLQESVIGRDGRPVRMGTMFEGWEDREADGTPAHTILRHFELYRARISIFCPPEHAEAIASTARDLISRHAQLDRQTIDG